MEVVQVHWLTKKKNSSRSWHAPVPGLWELDAFNGLCYPTPMKNTDEPNPLNGYKWIVYHPDLLGGKPAIKDTRMAVSFSLTMSLGRDDS